MDGRLNRSGNRNILLMEQAKRVCQEQSTRYIYSKEGMSQRLVVVPAMHRKNPEHPAVARKRQQIKFDLMSAILSGPDDVAHRPPVWALGRRFNAVLNRGRGQANVTWLVERVSRFTVILKKPPTKRTKPVMGKILKAIKDLPHYRPQIHHLMIEVASRQLGRNSGKNWYTNFVGSADALVTLAKRERVKIPIEGARRWLPQKSEIYVQLTGSRHQRNKRPPQKNNQPAQMLGWKTPAGGLSREKYVWRKWSITLPQKVIGVAVQSIAQPRVTLHAPLVTG